MINELTEPEKAWLACAIDGEGSIEPGLCWCRGKPQFHPRILVFNTSLSFVNEAERILGTDVKTRPVNVTTNKKTEYRAGLYDHKGIISILEQIFPYLIVKKEYAEVAIAWCKHRIETYKMPYNVKDYEYYLVLKSLNSRKEKTVKEVGEAFIQKIIVKCSIRYYEYVCLVIEAIKNLEVV